MKRINPYPKGLDILQKISVSIMVFLVMLTFVGANLHALLWQQSSWLVSTVLPAVVVDLTNDERQQLQAPDLRRNATLDQAAKLKAEHMAKNGYFSHYSPDGVSPWHWFDEAGYSYAHAGENLAIHFTDSSEVVDAWMKSPRHRDNIVNANYTEIGVGTAKGTYEGYDTVYVVQLFGTPAVRPIVPESTVETVVVKQSLDTSNELAELSAQANELAELVETLEAESVEVTEEPVVLSQNTESVEEITNVSSETAIAEEVEVEIDTIAVSEEISPEPEEASLPSSTKDVVVVESSIATSTGLVVASISEPQVNNQAGTTMGSVITKPNELLQWIYMILGMIVMALLLFSAVFEARKLHFVQVTYSIGLMVSMGALWYVHSLLTQGAVIV